MSGHSKWASIKHKKGAADAKRGKIFSKLSKAITIAASEGGADLGMNFTLRLVVDKAKAANMPKDNIERAIARGVGEGDAGALQSMTYEGMGPNGIAIIVEAVTDNPNRTFPKVRTIFSKSGGNMDAKVMWQFTHNGVVRVEDASTVNGDDDFEMALIEAGAEDIEWEDNSLSVIGGIGDLQTMEKVVSEKGLIIESAELEYIAKDTIELTDEQWEKLQIFIEKLEDDDDVTNVFTNVA